MYVSLIQSTTSLLLAGVFFYAVFVSDRLKNRRATQQVLLGVIFGLLVVVLGQASFRLEFFRAPLDAKSGPLIFAGYLGGPIGGFITAAIAGAYRYSLGGPFVVLGTVMHFLIPAVGVLFYYLRPSKDWPSISKSTFWWLLAGHAALHIVPIATYFYTIPGPSGLQRGVITALGFGGVGTISLICTWPILTYATRFASEANISAGLAHRLRMTLGYSGMGLLEQTRDSTDVLCDEGVIDMMGLDSKPGFVPIEQWLRAIKEEDRAVVRDAIHACWMGAEDSMHVDFHARQEDGRLRDIRVNWSVERDTAGVVERIIGLHTDLTDVRAAEREHRRTLEQFGLIAENLPGVIFQCEMSQPDTPNLRFIGPKCKEIWGYSDDEFLSDNQLFFNDELGQSSELLQAMRECISSKGEVSYRGSIETQQGTHKWLEYRMRSRTEEGLPLIEGIALDITREMEVQEQVERQRDIAHRAQKNESIGLLTGGVAHDFNNLLAVVLGNLDLLVDEEDPEERDNLIQSARAAVLHGGDLTKNMLAFARKARLTPENLDVNSVVSEAKSWITRTLPATISVETSLLAGLWEVEADKGSLEATILNLILNARDAMDGQGRLTIETSNVRIDEAYIDSRNEEVLPGRYVMLAVSDTGSGIPEQEMAKIFEPFFTTKGPGAGSGLGLSMIVGFMRQSGGTVQVYSEVGAGTTFKLYFPVAKGKKERQFKSSNPEKGMVISGQRILLAEDNIGVRDFLKKSIEREGYQVTLAASGDEALEIFKEDQGFDLLLTDIVMPGTLQGTDLAKEIRNRKVEMPVVFMSGYASEATVHGNGLRPEDTRLMKPVQRADLLAALAKVLQAKKEPQL